MRILVCSTAGSGHFSPLVPVVDAFARRGDDVLMVLPPELSKLAGATGHAVRFGSSPPAEQLEAIWERVPVVSRDEAAVLVNREIFGRLDTAAMLPAVERACDEWRPDLVLREPADFASAVAAERRGLPHVQVAIGLAGIEASSIDLAAPVLEPVSPGLPGRLLVAPYLTRFPASLDPSPFDPTIRFREPVADNDSALPDWWGGDPSPLLYVSFGTVAGALPIGRVVYRAAVEAVTGLPVRVLLTMGRSRDRAALGQLPRNVQVEDWVDQGAVMREASAVVCHGGAGTTFGSLAAGLPLVVVPLMADQPRNGRLVAEAGAGVVVDVDRSADDEDAAVARTASELRKAVEQVMANPTYQESAGRIGHEMNALPDLDAVVDTLASGLR